jgi:hypothetical protein
MLLGNAFRAGWTYEMSLSWSGLGRPYFKSVSRDSSDDCWTESACGVETLGIEPSIEYRVHKSWARTWRGRQIHVCTSRSGECDNLDFSISTRSDPW